MHKKIYLGFFQDAQGAGKVQIAADIYGLIELHRIFLGLSTGMDTYNFTNLHLLDIKYRINLIAYSHARNVGLKHTINGTYEWSATKEKWSEYRHQLIMLCANYTKKSINFEYNSIDKDDLQVAFCLDDFRQFQQ